MVKSQINLIYNFYDQLEQSLTVGLETIQIYDKMQMFLLVKGMSCKNVTVHSGMYNADLT